MTVTGYLDDDDDFTDHLAACDVSVNLRWPTAREMSGPWLRALAAGRPTIIIDLAHMADVPALDPRTWTVAPLGSPSDALPTPVTVAIDVLDEDHSLRLAMLRLANDPDLRDRLGVAAREYLAARALLQEHARRLPSGDRKSADDPAGARPGAGEAASPSHRHCRRQASCAARTVRPVGGAME